jgi:hypothetical protein
MQNTSEVWSLYIGRGNDGIYSVALRHFNGTTHDVMMSCERYSSSKLLFEELLSTIDASIFTSLAIAEGVLPEGQLPLY